MISNQFSKEEAERFIEKIADPMRFRKFMKDRFDIDLPLPLPSLSLVSSLSDNYVLPREDYKILNESHLSNKMAFVL